MGEEEEKSKTMCRGEEEEDEKDGCHGNKQQTQHLVCKQVRVVMRQTGKLGKGQEPPLLRKVPANMT